MGITAEPFRACGSDHLSIRRDRSTNGDVVFPMLVWRLHNDRDQHVDCFLQVTVTGAYRIRLQCGGDLTFTALAIDWRAARQVIDQRREELLRQGWQPST